MKAALICFVGCVVAATGYSSNNSRRAEKLALSADRVMIYSELEQREAGVVVTDAEWISRIAKILAQTPLDHSERIMGTGYITAHFIRGDEEVLSVAAILPKFLRVYSEKGGADFVVDEKACKQVYALIAEKRKANQLPDPTLSSVTPPAEQEPRPR